METNCNQRGPKWDGTSHKLRKLTSKCSCEKASSSHEVLQDEVVEEAQQDEGQEAGYGIPASHQTKLIVRVSLIFIQIYRVAHLVADNLLLTSNWELCFCKKVYTVTELRILCQQTVLRNQMGHPVVSSSGISRTDQFWSVVEAVPEEVVVVFYVVFIQPQMRANFWPTI